MDPVNGNQLILDRNVMVVDDDGRKFRFPEFLTKPTRSTIVQFVVEDISDTQFKLSFKDPPTFQIGSAASGVVEGLMSDPHLTEIKKYGVCSGFSHEPHW